MLGRCHTGLKSGRWLHGNHLLLGENVHLSGCWLLLGDTGYRETADCQQQFARKMPTYLQTLSNYSLSEVKLWRVWLKNQKQRPVIQSRVAL